ncbi:MAG: acetyl-CoA carboxylase biotin carboxyl carrier protein [Chitinophagales bacterium]|jgi:acetyl-CoA carboxylase biotin carboxyl carrier protein|nr:acetyl-CoA carboxylase biotin carboxyl carrier protein [Sphingobacteriales bacterium]
MDFKEIQELVKMFSKSGIGELKIEQENFSIKLKSNESFTQVISGGVMTSMPMNTANMMPAPVSSATPASEDKATPAAKSSGSEKTIKAPMIGTFYRSGGPDKEAFVKVGDRVEVGQVICIIEAMKLFNEIESDQAGTITKVLLNDASPVEYDQPLFIIE